MDKVYIVYTTFMTRSAEEELSFHIREEVNTIFDTEEKAIKFIKDAVTEIIDNPNEFEKDGFSKCVDWIPTDEMIKERTIIECGKHVTGAYIGLMYQSHAVE